tara:strand:+ start:2250 stop:2525 length:276 start_codon:yes stop_codon:yes gene_type:complete
MTRGQLKVKLQDVCEKHVTILDVFFYKHKDKQMVLVVTLREYGALSADLSCRDFPTIEKAIINFYDTKRLGTTVMDMSTNIQTANTMIEEL